MKLCDWNRNDCNILDNVEKYPETLSLKSVRLISHMAPETIDFFLKKSKDFTEKSDIFSLAIIFWELFHGKEVIFPHKIVSPNDHYEKLVAENARPLFTENFHKDLKILIEKMWHLNLYERPLLSIVKEFISKLK